MSYGIQDRGLSRMSLQLKGMGDQLKGASASPAFRSAARDISKRSKFIVQDTIRNTFKDQTGRLRRSWHSKVRSPRRGVLVHVQVSSLSDYAYIQSEGGLIVPKRARFLTVPISPIAKGRKIRTFTNTFVRNGIVFQRVDKRRAIALYALKTQVYIPRTGYLYRAGDRIRDFMKSRIEQAVRDLASGGRKG